MPKDPKPIRWKTLLVLLALALALGSLYRFTDLGKRPVHTDEAILMLKTQEYWRTGTFEYDPKDYHGPFLHHLTVWFGGLGGWNADAFDEDQARWMVALCGLLLVLTPLLFTDVIGRTGAGVSCLLIAVSPMMNYYSRYYIMEMVFVLQQALFIAIMWRWAQRKNHLWLVPAGLLLGWMHATKETFVLNIAALMAGYGMVKLMGLSLEFNQRGYGFRSFTRKPKSWWGWAVVLGSAALASTWMFSNGFRDWNFVTESIRTYESYLGRSQGAGGHEKPWHYYVTLLFWRQQGFRWSEALIGGLAIIGILNGFLDRRRADHKRAFLVCLSTYTFVLLAVYCSIPYKTPWSILGVAYALALLAGLGARTVFRAFTDAPFIKAVLALLMAGGIYHLCQQTSLATDYNFPHETRYAASELHNPYAYSHTVPNLVELSTRIHETAQRHPAKLGMPVQVIQSEHGWPIPWYLRDMTQVGYQTAVPETLQAPVVVVDADKEFEVRKKLQGEYESSLWGLRSGITLSLLVEKSLIPSPAEPAHPPATSIVPPVSTVAAMPDPVSTPPPVPPVLNPGAGTIPVPAPGSTALLPMTPPKAELVVDEVELVGPPYPVPLPQPPN